MNLSNAYKICLKLKCFFFSASNSIFLCRWYEKQLSHRTWTENIVRRPKNWRATMAGNNAKKNVYDVFQLCRFVMLDMLYRYYYYCTEPSPPHCSLGMRWQRGQQISNYHRIKLFQSCSKFLSISFHSSEIMFE